MYPHQILRVCCLIEHSVSKFQWIQMNRFPHPASCWHQKCLIFFSYPTGYFGKKQDMHATTIKDKNPLLIHPYVHAQLFNGTSISIRPLIPWMIRSPRVCILLHNIFNCDDIWEKTGYFVYRETDMVPWNQVMYISVSWKSLILSPNIHMQKVMINCYNHLTAFTNHLEL